MRPLDRKIEEALAKVETIVRKDGNKSDSEYFNFHKRRYLRMAQTVCSQTPIGASILNIGSHYLHTSLLFSFLGYEVYSMDVEVFWSLDFVKSRESTYDVGRIIENDLERLPSQDNIHDKYDLILFAEIFEHITFNPVNFWKRIYSIIKPSGFIYISTPNSLSLYSVFRTIGRVIMFKGIGLPIGSIFQNVTYGHHWKEYSVSEIEKYFAILSDDFRVKISLYHYRTFESGGFYSLLMSVLSFVGNKLYVFSDEIEAVVKVEKTGNWKAEAPEY